LVFYKDTENRFVRVNKYVADAHQRPKAALEGTSLFDLYDGSAAQAYWHDDLEVIHTGKPKVNIEEPWKTETGERWVSTSKIPYLDKSGKVTGVIGVSMDITESTNLRKEIQRHRDQLQLLVDERTQELANAVGNLRRSNQELEQFAYVASHDLQEPLRMVASYTQLLAERYQGKLDEKADKFIAYAVEGATRMQGLINDLLAFSRVGTRAEPLKPTASGEVVMDALKGLQAVIQESGAKIVVGDLPTIPADRSQLGQVFQNLIANAIKFRGELPPRVEITAERVGSSWRFCVADNGIGVDPQFHDRIFVIFQRLHERGKYPGSGIGLSIVKKVVERHGGRVHVESALGQGSRFYFTLPGESGEQQGSIHA
jgi:light-regulated signal transduction histidine kinase (bacteriophytochrome)